MKEPIESNTDQEATKVSGHLKRGVMQPAIDRLTNRVLELRKEIDELKSQGNMNHWAETAENTIQCLYVAIQVLELTEAAKGGMKCWNMRKW